MPRSGVPLPIVRRSGSAGGVPSQQSLMNAMQVATTADAAQYLYERFKDRVEQAKLGEKLATLVQEVSQFADYVVLQRTSNAKPWTGDSNIPSGFENLQQNLAASVVQKVSDEPITLDYAVSSDSQFIRGYSSEEGGLDEEKTASMDTLFNAWLVDNQMINQDGVIYEVDKDGQIKVDSQGQPRRVDPDKLRALVRDPSDGFGAYVSAKQASVQITTRLQSYPGDSVQPNPEEASPARVGTSS